MVVYLINPNLAILALCIGILGLADVFILREMQRCAATADPIIQKHAVPLLDVNLGISAVIDKDDSRYLSQDRCAV